MGSLKPIVMHVTLVEISESRDKPNRCDYQRKTHREWRVGVGSRKMLPWPFLVYVLLSLCDKNIPTVNISWGDEFYVQYADIL